MSTLRSRNQKSGKSKWAVAIKPQVYKIPVDHPSPDPICCTAAEYGLPIGVHRRRHFGPSSVTALRPLKCGFGWLPFWAKRMDKQYAYVGSTAELKRKASEYLKRGRYFRSIEWQEREETYRMVSGFLGEDVLMYASDYPHSECQFPNSTGEVGPALPIRCPPLRFDLD